MPGQEEKEKKALEEWFASISEEPGAPRAAAAREGDQPVMAAFEEKKAEKKIEPKVYTTSQLHDEMKKKSFWKRLLSGMRGGGPKNE
jgi:hypothetical protein